MEKELRAGSSSQELHLFPTGGSKRYKRVSVKALDEHRNNKRKGTVKCHLRRNPSQKYFING